MRVFKGCRKGFLRRLLEKKRMRGFLRLLCCFLACAGLLLCSAVTVSGAVRRKTEDRILSIEELAALGDEYDCILVLGCRVYEDGTMSAMLTDRVKTGVSLVEAGVCDTLLMSGDHRTDAYDEPGAMKAFAVEQGIASDRIFLDHDGYSTYDTMMRLKQVYGVERVVIVTQRYHLHRALYLADKLGMDAVGVSADLRPYGKQGMRDVREVFARLKDVYLGLKQPDPEVLGDRVLLSGNGDETDQSRPIP